MSRGIFVPESALEPDRAAHFHALAEGNGFDAGDVLVVGGSVPEVGIRAVARNAIDRNSDLGAGLLEFGASDRFRGELDNVLFCVHGERFASEITQGNDARQDVLYSHP